MKKDIIISEKIRDKIYSIRDMRVMLDRDLAELYGVETKVLNQAVTRNIKRFPEDFMFQLTSQELTNWRSQFVTSNSKEQMGLRRRPRAFTEQGVAMLSTVLNSERAIQVNIEIMRAFTRLRDMITNYKDLVQRIDEMESKYDENFRVVFDAIRQLIYPPEGEKRKIGFKVK